MNIKSKLATYMQHSLKLYYTHMFVLSCVAGSYLCGCVHACMLECVSVCMCVRACVRDLVLYIISAKSFNKIR